MKESAERERESVPLQGVPRTAMHVKMHPKRLTIFRPYASPIKGQTSRHRYERRVAARQLIAQQKNQA